MRRPLARHLAIAASLAVAALGMAPVLSPADAGVRNWASTYTETDSGHRLGNPEAPISLVTFVSYSCPHCATFEQQADAALSAHYVSSGKVSLEVRHVIRNPIDLAAVLTTECGPASGFFERHRAMMLGQEEWLAKALAVTPAQQQRWSTGSLAARMRAIAADLGFAPLMQRHGLVPAALDACLADEARAEKLVNTAQAQSRLFAIPGTPSFVIDGKLLDGVYDWAGLKEALDARS